MFLNVTTNMQQMYIGFIIVLITSLTPIILICYLIHKKNKTKRRNNYLKEREIELLEEQNELLREQLNK